MSNIVPFKKTVVGNITLNLECEALEDGSLWYRFKLSKSNTWSEWKMIE